MDPYLNGYWKYIWHIVSLPSWSELNKQDILYHRWWHFTDKKPQAHTNTASCKNTWTKCAVGTIASLFLDVWAPRLDARPPSIWRQATSPYFTRLYHTPFLTWHPLIAGLPILSSPFSSGHCHAASTTSPPLLFFASLRFSLAHRQCPFLGTKYWRELHKRIDHSRFSQWSMYSADSHGPTVTCNVFVF